MNTRAKGKRTMHKCKRWLENEGYKVEVLERGTRYGAKDIWGGDLVARDQHHLIWVQVKSNKTQIAAGRRELLRDDEWPVYVSRWVMVWPDRAKEPFIEVVK